MNEALKAKLVSKLRSTFCVYCASIFLSFPIAVTLIALITPALVPLQPMFAPVYFFAPASPAFQQRHTA